MFLSTGAEFGETKFDYGRGKPYAEVLIMYNGSHDYDYFEATCHFENEYWLGNIGASRPLAENILSIMTGYPLVNQGWDKKHQSYNRHYLTGTEMAEETSVGISFPSGTAPTY